MWRTLVGGPNEGWPLKVCRESTVGGSGLKQRPLVALAAAWLNPFAPDLSVPSETGRPLYESAVPGRARTATRRRHAGLFARANTSERDRACTRRRPHPVLQR